MTKHHTLRGPALLLPLLLSPITRCLGLSRYRSLEKYIPGIWKLQSPEPHSLKEMDFVGLEEEDILLKFNADGTFRQWNEEVSIEGQRLCGQWVCTDYRSSKHLLKMAVDRRGPTQKGDTFLVAEVPASKEEDGDLSASGEIRKGKFMYPRKHPAFFDMPVLVDPVQVGPFSIQQVLSNTPLVKESGTKDQESEELDASVVYLASDFYGKHFIMTITPVTGTKQIADQPADIRAMPMQFFQNNTFCCRGINKLLRGRFAVQNGDELVFEVSLFGAGRSAPGSVYSEGLGLSHEDKRNYLGQIVLDENDDGVGSLRVQGTVTFGSDLGSDARPEPVGDFILREMKATPDQDDATDDDYLDDNLFSPLF